MLTLLREGPAPLIRRQDYAEPAYWIRKADLSFDLDGAKTLVASRLSIERSSVKPVPPPARNASTTPAFSSGSRLHVL